MIEHVRNFYLLEKCMEDILYVIKPTVEDRNKRLGAIEEIVKSISLVGAFRDAAVKPFGSFVSKLYTKSGDLDVSVELSNGFPSSKKRKNKALHELQGALKYTGVSRAVRFISTVRVPVLHYVSNDFGISCDITIDNYPGRIKSRVLYWVNTLDGRFGDMVLLVKEWAKAQNINDPKNGTLNSYSLCLLVIIHFQTCHPAILPPMKEIFDVNSAAEMRFNNEKNLDEFCAANIAKFQCSNTGQRNQSPLFSLFVDFFMKVEDPFERSDNAARTVDVPGFQRIASAFKHAESIIYSYEPADRNELVSLLCTPEVGSKLGGRPMAECCIDPEIITSPQQHIRIHAGSTGSGPIRRPQGYNSARQTTAPYWHQQRRDQQNSRS